jgi:RimJ/RimL family protein N-acetyltransferase
VSVITTSRLELRPPHPDDAPALFQAYTADTEVTRFLQWAPHTSVDETATFIAGRIARWQAGEAYAWTISVDSDHDPIGMIELRPADGSIGYVLGRRWWSRGIMSEALQAVVHHAQATLGLSTLRAWCDAENHGSARVLEKNGFRLERTGPGPHAHSGFNSIRPALFYVRRSLY